MRLYVIGRGTCINWVTAKSLAEAKEKLGPDARVADDDDCRYVYTKERFWEWDGSRFKQELGCSRQTVHNWRKRGGGDIPTRTLMREASRNQRIRKVLAESPSEELTPRTIATEAKSNDRNVKAYAKRAGIKLGVWRKRPSDEQLVELQRDRTWWELAEVVGLKLSTLRLYIYARPELAAAMKAVRKPVDTGKQSQGKLPLHKIREMHNKGLTAHQIAESLHIEQMSVRYWLRKWKKEEEANDQTDEQGTDSGSLERGGAGAVSE